MSACDCRCPLKPCSWACVGMYGSTLPPLRITMSWMVMKCSYNHFRTVILHYFILTIAIYLKQWTSEFPFFFTSVIVLRYEIWSKMCIQKCSSIAMKKLLLHPAPHFPLTHHSFITVQDFLSQIKLVWRPQITLYRNAIFKSAPPTKNPGNTDIIMVT